MYFQTDQQLNKIKISGELVMEVYDGWTITDVMCDDVPSEQIDKLTVTLVKAKKQDYDFAEYADRLWKIAYERGKRDALEQTDCDTCKWAEDADEHCECCGEAYINNYEPQAERSE